jgi:type IV pilus assembly protein PilE
MQRYSGFTLIEMLITMAVIAILAAIALPSYTSYIMRSKITEATSNLLAMRTKLEQYYQDNRSYVGACAPGTVAPLPTFPPDPPGKLKYFTISCPTLTDGPPVAYIVRAAGITGTDLDGLTLEIDQANVRRTTAVPSGWTLPTTNCWTSKKGGDC